jgi:hypothetical protein
VVVDNGRHYRHSFKAGIVEASKNSKSLSAAPAMFRCTWAALFGEPPPFKCFVRSSVKLWRDVVAHYRTTAWVDSLRHDSFFLMADGSERKSKNILALYVVGFCSIEWEHVAVNSHYTYNVRVRDAVNLIDMGARHDAASNRKAVVWALTHYHGLELAACLGFICDNTASNSGEGIIGGFVAQIRRRYNVPWVRVPCTLHVVHIGWGHGRKVLMGPLPTMEQRFTVHLWNLQWLCYKEFGVQSPR